MENLLKYVGLMSILHFVLVWMLYVGTAAVDLTLIGHIRGWKRIKYAKWLGGAIHKDRRYGYEIVSDQTTHPQVIWFIAASTLVFGGAIGLDVGVWHFVNIVDSWVLWAIAAALYFPSTSGLIALKVCAKRTYLSHKPSKDEEDSSATNR